MSAATFWNAMTRQLRGRRGEAALQQITVGARVLADAIGLTCQAFVQITQQLAVLGVELLIHLLGKRVGHTRVQRAVKVGYGSDVQCYSQP